MRGPSIYFPMLFFLTLYCTYALASDYESIDSLEGQCDALSQAEKEVCKDNILKLWGVEINKEYKIYMSKLDQKGKDMLRNSEISWAKYRKAEIELLKSIMSARPGSVSKGLAMDYLINIDRNRAMVLRDFHMRLGN